MTEDRSRVERRNSKDQIERTMEGKKLLGVEDYESSFNPHDYFSYFKDPESNAHGNFMPFILSNYHKFWNCLGSNNLTVLEFGGGPTIYTLISACPFVREIIFAEFIEANRKEVEAWQKRESSSHDWSSFFKHVVQKLEGKSEEDAVKREEELRKKITRIIPCDITQPKPLHLNESSATNQPKFDIISTTCVLEASVKSDDAYCEAVVKLSKMLKPGGRLVMAGVLGAESGYDVGNVKFEELPQSESLLWRALDEAGFKNIHFTTNQTEVKGTSTCVGFDGWYFIHGVL